MGAVSALLGVLYALMEHDLKRLLAYSSVENIGIIFLGVGAGLMFQSYGLHRPRRCWGSSAGLYHTLNHACFKGLLFLGAGAVLHATHTRNMEELGGLIKRHAPHGALLSRRRGRHLRAAAAERLRLGVAGVPGAPGRARSCRGRSSALIMPLAVGMLALTSGLAAACFVKAFGITFLAIPRSPRAAQAREVPLTMQAGDGRARARLRGPRRLALPRRPGPGRRRWPGSAACPPGPCRRCRG